MAAPKFNTIVTGNYNVISGTSNTTILNGVNGRAFAYGSTILNGNSNYITASSGLIGNGFVNSATTGNYSTVINGNFNLASGQNSVIINGTGNRASGSYSIVGNGLGNLASGIHSAILNGASNKITGNRSAIIGGQNITGTTDDTVYMPNAVISGNLVVSGTTSSTPYVARVFIPSDQNVTTNGDTKIYLSGETFDPSGSWNTTTTTYVAPSTGYYQINTTINATNATTTGNGFGPVIYVNGAASGSTSINTIINTAEFYSATLCDIYRLNIGDSVELYCTRLGPAVSTLAVKGGAGGTATYLSITKL